MGEAPAREHGVGVAHEGNTQGPCQQGLERARVPGGEGQPGPGEPGRDGADQGNALLVQMQQGHGRRGQQHRQEGTRPAWGPALQDEHEGKGPQGHRQGGSMDASLHEPPLHHRLQQGVGPLARPRQGVELAAHHQYGHPGQVAHQDGFGEQIRQKTQP